jgi:triphosphoribosyl-dephospho-CoA synthase
MTLAEQIELACLLEATARKPGNVHPAASFGDLCYDDFVRAAQAAAKPLADVRQTGLGRAIFNAVDATQRETGTNVNLGIVLLIAPLAAVPESVALMTGISDVLNRTTNEDADHVYAAIRLAQPGGLGKSADQDVNDRPTVSLRDAMILAADRDRIAEQYASDYAFVPGLACRWLVDSWQWCADLKSIIPRMDDMLHLPHVVPWEAAIIRLHLRILADAPDSLVVRKCGMAVASQLQQQAAEVQRHGWPGRIQSWALYNGFDDWLRAEGHSRNPGTTADLVAACLFVAIRDGLIIPPSRAEVLDHAARIRPVGNEGTS